MYPPAVPPSPLWGEGWGEGPPPAPAKSPPTRRWCYSTHRYSRIVIHGIRVLQKSEFWRYPFPAETTRHAVRHLLLQSSGLRYRQSRRYSCRQDVDDGTYSHPNAGRGGNTRGVALRRWVHAAFHEQIPGAERCVLPSYRIWGGGTPHPDPLPRGERGLGCATGNRVAHQWRTAAPTLPAGRRWRRSRRTVPPVRGRA